MSARIFILCRCSCLALWSLNAAATMRTRTKRWMRRLHSRNPAARLGSSPSRGPKAAVRLASLLRQKNQPTPIHDFARRVLAVLSSAPIISLASPASSPHDARNSRNANPHVLPADALTPRELEILASIEQGLSNKQIAQRLVISDKTVENHITNIYQKLDVRSRTQAVRRAIELQLLTAQ